MKAIGIGATASIERLKKTLASKGAIEIRVRTEQERWMDVVTFVKARFPEAGHIDRQSFPFDLDEYENLIKWANDCQNCTNPRKCPHYGYLGKIRFKTSWQGRYYPDGVFVVEYYGGKCETFLNALKKGKKEETKAPDKAEELSLGFRC